MKIDDATIEARDRERLRLVEQIALRKSWLNGFASGVFVALGIFLAIVWLAERY